MPKKSNNDGSYSRLAKARDRSTLSLFQWGIANSGNCRAAAIVFKERRCYVAATFMQDFYQRVFA